jgi:predicted aldo/keto reductase-like oxidoreductase
MKEACYYVWSLPVSTAIVGCATITELEENVRLAKQFKPLADAEMKRLEKLTEHYAEEATFFKNWG